MKIHSIYDNGGETADRYTVYYSGRGTVRHTVDGTMRFCVCMNAAPFHPQGIGQHGEGMPGRHNGRKISWADLPKDCQRVVEQDLA